MTCFNVCLYVLNIIERKLYHINHKIKKQKCSKILILNQREKHVSSFKIK